MPGTKDCTDFDDKSHDKNMHSESPSDLLLAAPVCAKAEPSSKIPGNDPDGDPDRLHVALTNGQRWRSTDKGMQRGIPAASGMHRVTSSSYTAISGPLAWSRWLCS